MNINNIVITTLVATSLSLSAQANDLKAADHTIETELCLTAASGNRAAMHNEIKSSGKSASFVAKHVTCNGENILAFIERHGKNSQNMLKTLERSKHQVSITDIAKNSIDME